MLLGRFRSEFLNLAPTWRIEYLLIVFVSLQYLTFTKMAHLFHEINLHNGYSLPSLDARTMEMLNDVFAESPAIAGPSDRRRGRAPPLTR